MANIEKEKSTEQVRLRAIGHLTDDFCAIFLVNLDQNEVNFLKLDSFFGSIVESLPSDMGYDQMIAEVNSKYLHPQDKSRFGYSMSRPSILGKFRMGGAFFTNFRIMYEDTERFYQNKIIIVSTEMGNRSVIVGVRNVENEARQDLLRREQTSIINKLMDDYDCIIHVDFSNPMPTYYKVSDAYATLMNKWYGDKSFWERMEHYAEEAVVDDDREIFIENTRQEVVYNRLKKDGSYYVNYRTKTNGLVEYHQLKFISNAADANSMIVGIHNTDTEYRAEALKYEQSAIIAGLTSDYDCIGYVDLTGNTIKFYKGSQELSKYAPGWDKGGHFSECMKNFSVLIKTDPGREKFLEMVKTEKIVERIRSTGRVLEKFLLKLDDDEVYYDIKIVPDARRYGCLVIGFVNSDEHTREEQRSHELESLTTARHEFLSRMSHDIRTPINGVIGMLEVAKRTIGDTEKTLKALENVDISAHHLFALVDDVLDMTRIESGSVSLKHDTMDIRIMLDSFMSIAGGQLIGRDLNVIEEFEEFMHPYVLSDELRLRQILLNIVNNAIKFTADGGTIHIRAKEGGPVPGDSDKINYIFEIEDTGVGMSKEFVDHIFETFSQEKIGARTKYSGTGLGMSITKKYLDMFGASIDIRSELDEGSCFTITFPLAVDKERTSIAVLPAEIPTEHITSLKGTRIMIVEDNEINMEIAHTLLEAEGAVITEAENGQVALDLFNDSPEGAFDAILMDIMMPIMDGLEATKRIRQSPKGDALSIPIIALTANAFDEDRRKVLDAGMNAHLTKPLNVKTMVKTLTHYIMK